MKRDRKLSSEHHHLIDKLALANAVLSGITLYPQLFILLTSESDTHNISLLSFFLIATNSLVWLWYGLHRNTYPLIVSSLLNAIASGLIVFILL